MTSEIPADIQAKAEQVRDLMWLHSSPRFAAKAVAEALLAERERAAQIVEDKAHEPWERHTLAAAIRQQASP
jgi:hypothetical protein